MPLVSVTARAITRPFASCSATAAPAAGPPVARARHPHHTVLAPDPRVDAEVGHLEERDRALAAAQAVEPAAVTCTASRVGVPGRR